MFLHDFSILFRGSGTCAPRCSILTCSSCVRSCANSMASSCQVRGQVVAVQSLHIITNPNWLIRNWVVEYGRTRYYHILPVPNLKVYCWDCHIKHWEAAATRHLNIGLPGQPNWSRGFTMVKNRLTLPNPVVDIAGSSHWVYPAIPFGTTQPHGVVWIHMLSASQYRLRLRNKNWKCWGHGFEMIWQCRRPYFDKPVVSIGVNQTWLKIERAGKKPWERIMVHHPSEKSSKEN